MWYFCLFVSCFGVVFMPFVQLYLRIHSFIYLSILSQFTSLLRSFSSYETSQSVGVVKTGESREKKICHIFKQNLSHMCTVCGLEQLRRSNETRR